MLDSLFYPKSLAVIGASRSRGKVGNAVITNIKESSYNGTIYPINPKHDEIFGIQTFGSILDIDDRVDLAIIAIPARFVPQVLSDCVSGGVQSVVIISAGFKETGTEGLHLEEEIKSIIHDSTIRVLGPNCLGIINTANRLNATFAAGMLPKGRLAFFSQSGALGIAILDWAIGNNIGFSKFISLGNKTDLNESDFIEYFMHDTETDIILGYIEDVVEGKRFLEIAKKATKIKPIILMKSGGTRAGARAASSHTGALAGSEHAFRAAFTQTGIIRAEGIEDLFETAMAFNARKLPERNNLLIITNAGGPGIIAADCAEKNGIHLPQLTKETLNSLINLLPRNASLYNPVDIIGDAPPERYADVLEHGLNDPHIDGFLIILTPQAMTDITVTAEIVIDSAKRTKKPFITCFMGEKKVRSSIDLLQASSIPQFSYPEPAVRAFRRLYEYRLWQKKDIKGSHSLDTDRSAAERILHKARSENSPALPENDARDILSHYGFLFPAKYLAQLPKEAVSAARKIGFPVVMKISSPDILHKTDVGGVKTGINSAKEVEDAFLEITSNARRLMPAAFINGVAVFETARTGKEVIIGITYDRTFGHMIMFGLGGIYVEILKDVAFRIVPVGLDDAREMVSEIKTLPLLQGARGEKPADLDAIVTAILQLSKLASDFPFIQEIDINPLVVYEKGSIALDARIIINNEKRGGS